MTFIEEAKKSIYNPSFYNELKGGSIKYSIGYFFRLSCVLALLSTIVFSLIFIPRFMKITGQESIDSLVEVFPKELTLTIQSGHLSTNVPEPYMIKMPAVLNSFMGSGATTSATSSENLVVISTQSDPSISQIDQILTSYKSHVLVTGTNIISRDSGGKTTVQSLSSFPNTSINQAKFKDFVEKLRPLLKFIVPISIPFIFLAFLVFFSLNLIFGLFLALLILLLSKFFKWNLDYWHSYAIGLHSITLGVVIVFLLNTLMAFAPFELTIPRFTFSLVAILITYLNLRKSTSTETAAAL